MLVRTKFNSQRKPSWAKNRLYLNHQVDWKQTAKSYNAIRAIFSVFRMYSTEFDSGCLVCFIEIISCADPQWEIPLYVWLKISALSRSSSCFRPDTPVEAEICTSIPVFFLESTPPPLPECLPFIPDPVNICLAGIQVFLLRTGTFSAINGNRPMTLIRITGN